MKVPSTVNKTFRVIIQPFLFCHINIRTMDEALELFELFIQSSGVLAHAVHTLQISFDLDPAEYQGNPQLHQVWKVWETCRPDMFKLQTLTLCFDHSDVKFLLRFIRKALPQKFPKLRTLSLTPLPDQRDSQVRNNLDYLWGINGIFQHNPGRRHSGRQDPGAWDHSSWAIALCHQNLADIEHLIVTTPHYPLSPPTLQAATNLCQSWLGGLSDDSRFQTIILHSGFVDEGARIGEYAEQNGELEQGHPDCIPAGILAEEMTYSTGWPRTVDMSWEIHTIV